MRSDHESSTASAAVGAPTSGAAGVGRAPARGPKGARRAVLRRTTAGHQEPHGCRGELGSVGPAGVTLQFAIAPRARGFQRYAAGAQPRPPPNAGPAAPQTLLERRDEQCGDGSRSSALIAYRARAPHREGWCGEIAHDEFGSEPEEAIAGVSPARRRGARPLRLVAAEPAFGGGSSTSPAAECRPRGSSDAFRVLVGSSTAGSSETRVGTPTRSPKERLRTGAPHPVRGCYVAIPCAPAEAPRASSLTSFPMSERGQLSVSEASPVSRSQ